ATATSGAGPDTNVAVAVGEPCGTRSHIPSDSLGRHARIGMGTPGASGHAHRERPPVPRVLPGAPPEARAAAGDGRRAGCRSARLRVTCPVGRRGALPPLSALG